MARFRWLNACTLCTLTITGIWSQIKRAPASNKKRKTYEVDGPARPNAMPLDQRARQVFSYFKKYNYEVKGTGEVITFVGLYAADKGQAAAVTFYTFCGASYAKPLGLLSAATSCLGDAFQLYHLGGSFSAVHHPQAPARSCTQFCNTCRTRLQQIEHTSPL